MSFTQILEHMVEFLPATLEHQIVQVLPNAWTMSRNNHHPEPVDIMKLTSLGFRRTRHAGQFFVHPEIVLDGNGCVGLGLLLNGNPFLRLDRLMQTVAPSTTGHQATGVLIHDHYLSTLHNVLLVLLVQAIGSQKLGDRMNALAPYLEILFGFFLLLPLFVI